MKFHFDDGRVEEWPETLTAQQDLVDRFGDPATGTCPHLDLDIRCKRCDTYFKCGAAPHDSQGSLCPGCGSGRIELVEEMDDAWECPRCASWFSPDQEVGGSNSPLCDDCWEAVGSYGNGYWAGRAKNWAPEPAAFDYPALYVAGFQAGRGAGLGPGRQGGVGGMGGAIND